MSGANTQLPIPPRLTTPQSIPEAQLPSAARAPPACRAGTPQVSWPSSRLEGKAGPELARRQTGSRGCPCFQTKGTSDTKPHTGGRAPESARKLPLLTGPHTIQQRTWGFLAVWLTQNRGEACFLRPPPPGCFTRHAGDPGKCHPPHGAARPLWGGFHLESRKTLPTVSKATGLSEQSASLCTRVGHVSQPSGDQKGPGPPLPAALRPAMALIKWFSKARATAVKGNPANWSINSADSHGSWRAPQLQFLGNNVQINCKQIKLQLQAARGGGWRGARNALAVAQAGSWSGRGSCLALLSFIPP